MRHTTWRAASVLAAGALVLAACGGDDGATTDTDTPTDAATTAAAGDAQAFCDALYAAENAPEPEIDFETATEEEIGEAQAQWFADVLTPLAEDVLEAAPEEIRPSVEQAVTAIRESQSFEVFESEEFMTAENEMDAYILDNCEGETVEVAGVEYAFNGAPSELSTGTVLFDFANDGAQMHEMVVLRKNDDTTESWEELLQLPEEEGMQKASFVGGAFAPPGEDDVVQIRFEEEGEYLMVCFIPVGATAESMESDEEPDGPPHFTEGMLQEFTVTS